MAEVNYKSINDLSNNEDLSRYICLSPEYRQAMDLQRDMICCFRADGNICYANPQFLSFFGSEGAASWFDYFPIRTVMYQEIHKLLSGEPEVTFQTESFGNSGEKRILLWVCNILPGPIIQASARNITSFCFNSLPGEDDVEKSVDIHSAFPMYARDSGQFYGSFYGTHAMLHHLPLMVWAVDKDLNILFWNLECEQSTGYSYREVYGNKQIFSQFFPDPKIRKKRLKELTSCKYMSDWTAGINCKDGSVKWFSCFNVSSLIAVDGWDYLMIGIDRTAKQMLTQAVKASEKRYRSLFSSIRAGLLLFGRNAGSADSSSYSVLDLNPSAEVLLGMDRNSILSQSLLDLFPGIGSSLKQSCQQLEQATSHVQFQYFFKPQKRVYEVTLFAPSEGECAALFVDITEIITAREELQTQLEFMQTLIDTIPNPIFFKDNQGKIFNCNTAFEEYTGITKEDLFGKSITDLDAYLDLKDILDTQDIEQELLRTQGHLNHEYTFKHADGTRRHLIVNRAVFCNKDGSPSGTVGIFTDISEKRHIERRLKKQLDFQKFLMENIPAPVFFLNTHGRYFVCNKAFEAYSGKNRNEIIGESANELPACVDLWNYYISRHLAGDHLLETQSGTYATKFYHIDGSVRDVIINQAFYSSKHDDTTGLVGVIMDVTRQHQAEKKLKDQIKFLEILLETIPNPVYYRALDGTLLECNKAYADLFGQPREELIGTIHFKLVKPEQAQVFYDSDAEMLARGLNNIAYESVVELPDGRKANLLINKTILHDTAGQISGLLGAITDLTEHREMERSMARLDQYKIIGEMAAAIGHEVRNPMTTVRGFLQLLLEKGEANGNEEYFDLMIEEIDRANSIISDFLSLGKDLRVELNHSNLNEVVKQSHLILDAEAKKMDHQIQFIPGEIPCILLDIKQIRQLVFNLVSNGLEAMTLPGTVTIRTFRQGDEVVLSIQDQGGGIDANILETLGKPFITTKEKGTGLGLAVCFSIAERHGARLNVQTSNTGTNFFVHFPIPDLSPAVLPAKERSDSLFRCD